MTDTNSETKRIGEMLDELLAVESGLTDWEVGFIESLDKRRESAFGGLLWAPSSQQAAKVEGIWGERCG